MQLEATAQTQDSTLQLMLTLRVPTPAYAAAKRIDLALACVTLPQPVAVQRVVSAPGPLGDGPHCAMNAWLPVALQREG